MSPAAPSNNRRDSVAPQAGDALLIIDVQRDFLPGGALAVRQGERVVPVLNRYVDEFQTLGLPIVATRDWHPPNHCSFVPQGGRWPVHCVAGTPGAAFADDLRLPADVHVISKATEPDREQFSDFPGSDLGAWLRSRHVRRLFIGGLATDYCVLANVRDARHHGFQVVLLTEAIAAVDDRDGAAALEEMQRLGAQLL